LLCHRFPSLTPRIPICGPEDTLFDVYITAA
jgi:hypothetical protein